MNTISWIKPALFILVLGGLIGNFVWIGMNVGNKENLDDLQKNLGIAVAVLASILIVMYFLLYLWVQAEGQVFIPMMLGLSFMNSLIGLTGLTSSIMIKQ